MKKYLLFAVVLVAVPLLVAGCTSSSNLSPSSSPSASTSNVTTALGTQNTSSGPASPATAGAGSQIVSIPDLSFQPASLTIQKGMSVTWRNDALVSHQVVSDTNAFSSPVLNPGATYTHVFDLAGTYPYHCAIHPSMTGTITVQ